MYALRLSRPELDFLDSRGKEPSKKKQDDSEINTTDRGDRKDRGYHGNRQQ
jgi:hypothetical protein